MEIQTSPLTFPPLMTLNIYHVLHYAQDIVCTKFELSQGTRSRNVTIFDANTLCHAMTLTYDPLKVCGKSGYSKYDQNRTISD